MSCRDANTESDGIILPAATRHPDGIIRPVRAGAPWIDGVVLPDVVPACCRFCRIGLQRTNAAIQKAMEKEKANMDKFVPLEKQSKKKKRAYYAARRGSWGGLNPVTRKPPKPKAYRKKKSRGWEEDDSSARDYCFGVPLFF